MFARVECIEVRNAVHAENNRLAVDDELGLPVPQCGFGYPRISLCPVKAVSGEQPDTITVAFQAQTIPVIFDFVEPIRCVRNLWFPV
jgi:hypothetical protein